MIIDGKAIAEDLYGELTARRAAFGRPPRLGILIASDDPVTRSFVGIKARAAERLDIEIIRTDLPVGSDTEQAINAVRELSEKADGIIVQLPLPKEIDINAVLSEISPQQDVDGLNPRHSVERLVDAPVARAALEILMRAGIEPNGKRAVVVGAGRLVGAPAAALLKKRGAIVSMFTLQGGSIEDLKDTDIVVLGAGNPGFIKSEHLKDGVALIDAGASEQGGKIVGDADPACAGKCSVFTPVPGGVGPVAVAMIFKNLFDLMEVRS